MANQYTLKNGGYEPFIGNFGLVPQPPIPEPDAEDNGKVLGVSNGSYALVNGGGGGGGSVEPMIVNMNETETGSILDVTAKEIYDAYISGRLVLVVNTSTYEGGAKRFTYFSLVHMLFDEVSETTRYQIIVDETTYVAGSDDSYPESEDDEPIT